MSVCHRLKWCRMSWKIVFQTFEFIIEGFLEEKVFFCLFYSLFTSSTHVSNLTKPNKSKLFMYESSKNLRNHVCLFSLSLSSTSSAHLVSVCSLPISVVFPPLSNISHTVFALLVFRVFYFIHSRVISQHKRLSADDSWN